MKIRSIGWSETLIKEIIYNSINSHKEIRSGAIPVCEACNAPDFYPPHSILFNSLGDKRHEADPDQNVRNHVQ